MDIVDVAGDIPEMIADHVDDLAQALGGCDFTDLTGDVVQEAAQLDQDALDPDLFDHTDALSDFVVDASDSLSDLGVDGVALLHDAIGAVDYTDVPLDDTAFVHASQGFFESTPDEAVQNVIESVIDRFPADSLQGLGLQDIHWYEMPNPASLAEYSPMSHQIYLWDATDQLPVTVAHEIGHHVTMDHPDIIESLSSAWQADGEGVGPLAETINNVVGNPEYADYLRPGELAAEMIGWYTTNPALFAQCSPISYTILQDFFHAGASAHA
jgi:hypothetical protein